MIKAIIQIMLFAVPWSVRRWVLCKTFGFVIAPTANIGFSIIFGEAIFMGEKARIGHLTIIKGLNYVRIDEFAALGNMNWVTGVPSGSQLHFKTETHRIPSLHIERHAAVTHRHLIDCTDRVTIGAFTTVGGWGSQILTHAIDIQTGRQSCAPTTIGRYCFVGTRAVFLKGSVLPDKSVLAAGSVLTRKMTDTGMLYCGVPATAVRQLDVNGKYFTRETGFVF